ncbi:MAG: NAD(P)/FAD-dependent oxidoreductase [Paracoccaceae bacterium]
MTKTIAVIGAGIVGVSTAIWLLRDGFDVVLIDRDGPAAGASQGNAGLLASCACVPVTGPGLIQKAPGMLLNPEQPLFLKWGYLPKLAPWLVRFLSNANAADTTRIASAVAGVVGDSLSDHLALASGTGAEKWIVPSDYAFLYPNRAAFEKESFGWSLRRENGFQWDELEGNAIREWEPAFSPDLRFATRLGNHGRITSPGDYVRDLASHMQDQGGRLVLSEVDDLVRENGKVTGVRAGGDTIPCDAAVLTTGVWSGPLAKKLGINIPLEAERGYHIELWDPSFMPNTPAMVTSGKFVATPMEGRLRLAGVVELGGTKAGPSRAPLELLKRNVATAFPGLQWKEMTEWMGFRPSTPDSIPVIGAIPGLKGAYAGFGHQHIGLTAGPKTGRLLAQIIAGRQPNMDMAPYSPDRFVTGGC